MTFFGAAGVGLVKMMSSNTSNELRKHLCDFVQGQEKAFEPVARQLSGLIYHTALRRSGDHSCAEEVVQTVLVQISRKAAKLAKHPEPLAWVHEVSRLETLKFQRGELRRKKREEKAMKTPSDERSTDPHLLAELDESMKVLKDSERELILMKYFQGQTFSAIAAETGRSESAEKMRLKRALETMAGWFGKKGVTLSVAGLTTVLSTEMSKAAPVGVGIGTSFAGMAGAVGGGTGKFGFLLSSFVGGALAIGLVSTQNRISELEKRRNEILAETADSGSGRRQITDQRRERHWTEILRLDGTMEEKKLTIDELVWRFQRADALSDYLAKERLVTLVATMEHDEVKELCRRLNVVLPDELIELVGEQLTGFELVEFLMEVGVSDGNVKNKIPYDIAPLEFARWLIRKEQAAEIINRGYSHDYRQEFWWELYRRFRSIDQKDISPELIRLVEVGAELAPLRNRPSLKQLVSDLRKKGGEK